MASRISALWQTSPTALPSSPCFKVKAIGASPNFDLLMVSLRPLAPSLNWKRPAWRGPGNGQQVNSPRDPDLAGMNAGAQSIRSRAPHPLRRPTMAARVTTGRAARARPEGPRADRSTASGEANPVSRRHFQAGPSRLTKRRRGARWTWSSASGQGGRGHDEARPDHSGHALGHRSLAAQGRVALLSAGPHAERDRRAPGHQLHDGGSPR